MMIDGCRAKAPLGAYTGIMRLSSGYACRTPWVCSCITARTRLCALLANKISYLVENHFWTAVAMEGAVTPLQFMTIDGWTLR